MLHLVLGLEVSPAEPDSLESNNGSDSFVPEMNRDGSLKSTKQVTLHIDADFSYTSDALPCREDALNVFETSEIRDLLISGGGSQKISYKKLTQEYIDLWNTMYSEYSQDNEQLENEQDGRNISLLITEIEIKFPGLRVSTASVTGVTKSTTAGMPVYEYRLLAQNQRAEGSRLAVWIFQHITGNAKRLRDQFYPPPGLSISRASLVETTKTGALVLVFDCWLKLKYPMPAYIVRLLPFSRKRVETIIRGPITKMARKEVQKGVVAASKVMADGCARSATAAPSNFHNHLNEL